MRARRDARARDNGAVTRHRAAEVGRRPSRARTSGVAEPRRRRVRRDLRRVRRGLRRRVRRRGGPARAPAGRRAGRVHDWRSSLQVRIGAITMVVAGTVVVIVSLVLFSQIRDQLLSVKRQAAIDQAQAGVVYAQTQVAGIATGDAASVRSDPRPHGARAARTRAARPATSTSSWSTGPATTSAPPRAAAPSSTRCPPDLRADVDAGNQVVASTPRSPTRAASRSRPC